MKITLAKKAAQPKDEGASEALATIQRKYGKMQLRQVPRPVGISGNVMNPVLPADLTVLNDVQLGRLYGEFAAMAQYAQLQLAIHGVTAAVSRRDEKIVRAKARLRAECSRDDKPSFIEVQDQVKKATLDLVVCEGVAELTRAVFEGFLVGRDALSRELTRRGLTNARDQTLDRR